MINCMQHGIKKRQCIEENHKIKKYVLSDSLLYSIFSAACNVKNNNPPAINPQDFQRIFRKSTTHVPYSIQKNIPSMNFPFIDSISL